LSEIFTKNFARKDFLLDTPIKSVHRLSLKNSGGNAAWNFAAQWVSLDGTALHSNFGSVMTSQDERLKLLERIRYLR
jgi:hypothetical protein